MSAVYYVQPKTKICQLHETCTSLKSVRSLRHFVQVPPHCFVLSLTSLLNVARVDELFRGCASLKAAVATVDVSSRFPSFVKYILNKTNNGSLFCDN